ncbi:hypothetical protein C2845_PM15G17050 [Panicum miliaceum]|uniref:Uncharacterized protein n=1 Tax=Panicum miliaceum TaxID=4540 RepID=A0A3L6Q816_PANMI|nr:hypothetical protein C2845_PM15G17050 [Panicum miliaceum]
MEMIKADDGPLIKQIQTKTVPVRSYQRCVGGPRTSTKKEESVRSTHQKPWPVARFLGGCVFPQRFVDVSQSSAYHSHRDHFVGNVAAADCRLCHHLSQCRDDKSSKSDACRQLTRSKRRKATNNRATTDEEKDSDEADSDYAQDEEELDGSTEDGCSEPELEDNEASSTEDEDNEPLAHRLNRMQSSASKRADGQASNIQGNLNNRRSRLRLPDNKTNTLQPSGKMTGARCSPKEANTDAGVAQQANKMMDAGSSRTETNNDHGTVQKPSKMVDVGSSSKEASASKRTSWDFPVPDCDIMKFVEEPTPLEYGMQHVMGEIRSADSGST